MTCRQSPGVRGELQMTTKPGRRSNPTYKPLQSLMHTDLLRRIEVQAVMERRTKAEIVEQAISEYLERHEGGEGK